MYAQKATPVQPKRADARNDDSKKTKKNKEPSSNNKKEKRGNKVEKVAKDPNKNLYLKYKTSVCRHYEQTGYCELGDLCNFAHGSDEKRNMNDVSYLNSFLG